jgi:hypothetical protein
MRNRNFDGARSGDAAGTRRSTLIDNQSQFGLGN